MAIIHDRTEDVQVEETQNIEAEENTNIEKKTEVIPPKPAIQIHTEVKISVAAAFSGKKRGKKAEYDNPEQISIFDFLAS